MPSTSDLRLILAASATLALAAFFVSAHEARGLRADLTVERAKADSVFRAYQDAKAQVDGTTTMAQQRERELQRLLATAKLRRPAVRPVVPPSAPPETLVVIAETTLAELDTVYGILDTLTNVAEQLSEALRLERWQAQQALDAADSTLAAKEALIAALSAPPRPCRVLGVPCPTRTQSAAAGAILALLAVVAR